MSHYGFCPKCGAPGVNRERRPDGNDTCADGHVYPAKDAIQPYIEPEPEFNRKDWYSLVLEIGRRAGRVYQSQNEFRFHMGTEGCSVTVPRKEFEALVEGGFIDEGGKWLRETP